jgi:hypothetical protein
LSRRARGCSLAPALGGTAYATGALPPNSVGNAQLKSDAVTGAKVKDGTLKALDLGKGQLKPGPRGEVGATGARGPAGQAGVVDQSLFYTRADANARFLGGALVTAVVTSPTIANGVVIGATATCPAGFKVIAGGVDPANVLAMFVVESEPVIDGVDIFLVPDGLHSAPNGWRVFVENLTGDPRVFKVVAICAPVR